MKVLLVNDDGIHAPGIAALREAVSGYAEITVLAPHQERSGMSQAITVHQPLRLYPTDKGYMLDGTPADCVKMAMEGLKLSPDFVLSGINGGANLGTDVLYSGTVAAAMEGTLYGIPSIALSLCGSQKFFPEASETVRKLLFEEPGLLQISDVIPAGGLLNINIPALPLEQIKGTKITRLGIQAYSGVMEKREDPRGGQYYWMGGHPLPSNSEDLEIDLVAVKQGYISITPIQFDRTFHQAIPNLVKMLG